MVDVGKLLRNGRAMLLAYDHGFEHGPVDFDPSTGSGQAIDPQYVFDIAEKSGMFTCIAVQKGIAEKYYRSEYKTPLVVKLNGKTGYHKGEELFSPQNCSVGEAIKLGAAGVGYTIYVGSEREGESIAEFSKIQEEARAKDLPVVMWAYPRGKHIGEAEHSKENLAYASRLALELGADMVKVSYVGNVADMKWVVAAAGKVKVLVVGGGKTDEETFLRQTREIIEAGAVGWAVGRNMWQNPSPIEFARKVGEVLYGV